jgi:hypothetical protein
MTFEYKLAKGRGQLVKVFGPETAIEPTAPAPRLARLVALAHKLEALVRSNRVKDYAELARLARVSPARISQIIVLGQLAPDIQEFVLFLSAEQGGLITEVELRGIAREPRWDKQRTAFENLLGSRH